MLTPRTDLVAWAALVAENAALREENATLRLRADSQRIMAACSAASAAEAPIPSIPVDHDCEFSGYIELNIGHWLPHAPNGVGGTVTPGTYTGSSANYLVSGGRVGGAWDLTIKRILVNDSIYGQRLLKVRPWLMYAGRPVAPNRWRCCTPPSAGISPRRVTNASMA
jgi:hypothetical protein